MSRIRSIFSESVSGLYTAALPENTGKAVVVANETAAPELAEPLNAGRIVVVLNDVCGDAPATCADPEKVGSAVVLENDATGDPTIRYSVAVPRSIESSKSR